MAPGYPCALRNTYRTGAPSNRVIPRGGSGPMRGFQIARSAPVSTRWMGRSMIGSTEAGTSTAGATGASSGRDTGCRSGCGDTGNVRRPSASSVRNACKQPRRPTGRSARSAPLYVRRRAAPPRPPRAFRERVPRPRRSSAWPRSPGVRASTGCASTGTLPPACP